MGRRNPDREPRLMSLEKVPPGYVWLAVCMACDHRATLPVATLLARFGPVYPVDKALSRLRCSACQVVKVDARLFRLCEPGCPRQRG